MTIRGALQDAGLPPSDLHDLPTSEKRFPDGAHYRLEIPSTEGPRCLDGVLEEADRLDVPVHRVSQGSGVFMLTDAELDEFVAVAAAARIEISLFARPNAGWDASATSRSPAGGGLAAAARGQEQLVAVLEDVVRAAEHGVRSVLIADVGALYAFSRLRAEAVIPTDMQAKVSVMLPVANAATATVLADLGASTLNLPPDLTLAQVSAIRAAVDLPIDFYVEAPETLGGFVRLHEIPELIRVAAPVYVKFGLRNAAEIYPSGGHVETTAIALSRERVRRARLGLELLERSGLEVVCSEVGAAGLAVPTPAAVVRGSSR
jgi:Peptidase family U32